MNHELVSFDTEKEVSSYEKKMENVRCSKLYSSFTGNRSGTFCIGIRIAGC